MQKLKFVKKLLSAIVLLSTLWLLFFFTQLFCQKPENKNDLFVPDNSTFAVRINGRSIAEHTFFSVFLEGRDEKLLRKIQNTIDDLKDQEIKDLGINFLSDMIMFSCPYKDGDLIGISVNLLKPSAFKKNCPSIFSDNQFYDVRDNVGMILFYRTNDKKNKVKSKELLSFLHKHTPAKNPFISDIQEKKIVQMYTKGSVFGNSAYFCSSNLFFETQKSKVTIEGKLNIIDNNSSLAAGKTYFLETEKESFHFSTAIVSNTIQDSLKEILDKMGLKVPQIRSISMNYKGMQIVNNETGMHTLPNIDLVLKFKNPTSARSILNDTELLSKLEAQFHNNQLTIGNHTYYVQQLNKYTIFFGNSKNPIFSNDPEIVAIRGNLSSILKIEGGGIITSFLEIVPIYRASKELFNNTKNFEVVIKKENEKFATIKGDITFKKGHYPMSEFLKFLLESKASFD